MTPETYVRARRLTQMIDVLDNGIQHAEAECAAAIADGSPSEDRFLAGDIHLTPEAHMRIRDVKLAELRATRAAFQAEFDAL